ncbi:hypothetical protein Tco_0547891 [Tanacetum coccineum]
MENANPSSSTPNSEFLDPKKKLEIESWLEDSKIVDPLVSSDDVEYFDTFPTLEELGYHEWLLKYPKPSWEEGTVVFEKDNEKITFKMPHKMKTFNHIDFKDVDTNSILENNDNHGKTYYSDSLILGTEYREDESISKEIRHLMKLEIEARKSKEEVMFLALGWHLEEIHVTWAHLEKKRTRLRTYTKSLEESCLQSVEMVRKCIMQRRRDLSNDGVRKLMTGKCIVVGCEHLQAR